LASSKMAALHRRRSGEKSLSKFHRSGKKKGGGGGILTTFSYGVSQRLEERKKIQPRRAHLPPESPFPARRRKKKRKSLHRSSRVEGGKKKRRGGRKSRYLSEAPRERSRGGGRVVVAASSGEGRGKEGGGFLSRGESAGEGRRNRLREGGGEEKHRIFLIWRL